MPNGYHNDPSIDQIYHRHTEHGQPRFQTKRHSHGFVSVHLHHHGGYVHAPEWDTLDLYPFVETQRQRPTRAEVDELAADLVRKLVALQSTNPNGQVRAQWASGLVLYYNWCIVFGDYHVYTRTGDEPFERIEPPLGSRTPNDLLEGFKMRPDLEHIAHDTTIRATSGLLFHNPNECVYDIDGMDELLASTVKLHEQPGWSQISRMPVDSLESTGQVVMAMRHDAVAHGTDHVVIRWRNPSRKKKPAGKTIPPKDESASNAGELRVMWGTPNEEVIWLHSYCTIGRSSECTIVFDDDFVSRRHADIILTPRGYVLADSGSTSGVYVNDRKIWQHVLEDGDRIRIGPVLMEFTAGYRTLVDNHLRRHDKAPIVAAMSKHVEKHANNIPLCLVLFDLDHLKRVNDFEGLYAGDAVLAHVESIARAAVRPQDTFARIGGEEFGIVLPEMDLPAAVEFAEKLRCAVEASSCVFEGREIPMTISCGVARWVNNIHRPWVLFRLADNRLHEAKSRGRNQVRC